MTPAEVLAFLARQRQAAASAQQGDRATAYAAFESLYDRRLWHQLTVQLLAFVSNGTTTDPTELLALYTNFIADFESKLNQLTLAQIAVAIAHRQDAATSRTFLEGLRAKVQGRSAEAHALLLTELGQLLLDAKEVDRCRKNLTEAEALLDTLPGLEPVVHASFYRVSANVDKATANFVSYYKNALLYLSCTPLASIPAAEQTQRAHDLALAALLGETIYNFGDLLSHEVLLALKGTEHEWLGTLLEIFNRGDLDAYGQILPRLLQQPDLAARQLFLRQKISMMALVEMLFRRDAGDRRVTFDAISVHIHLPRDEVEHLLMKSMSLGLVRATLDEVDSAAEIAWVQPRILDRSQIGSLATRLHSWSDSVSNLVTNMRTEAPELFAA